MIEQVMSAAISNGIFAVLFVFLLIYQLKDSSIREKKYQNTIEKLGKHLDKIDVVDEKVSSIKISVERRHKQSETKG